MTPMACCGFGAFRHRSPTGLGDLAKYMELFYLTPCFTPAMRRRTCGQRVRESSWFCAGLPRRRLVQYLFDAGRPS